MTTEQFEDFVNGYLEAAIFADLPEQWVGKKSVDDLTKESVKQAWLDCRAFLALAEALIVDDEHVPGSHSDTPWNHAGRDFYYTRRHHGCGFWDGDWKRNGDALTKIAQTFHESFAVEVGPGGKVYIW